MKVRYLLYILLLLFLACEFQTEDDSEEDKTEGEDEISTCSVALSLPWTGDYSIDTAAYTIRNVETGEEFTGTMTCDTANKTATAALELTEGYWEAEARVEHTYTETSGAAFAFDTGIGSTYVWSLNENNSLEMPDPFSQDINGLVLEADISEMVADGRNPAYVGAWLYNPEDETLFYFELKEGTGSYRSGSFPSIKRGKYVMWMRAENSAHPDWADNPWQEGLTTVTRYAQIDLNDYDGSVRYENFTLKGEFVLNPDTMNGQPGTTNTTDDDLFNYHTENGSLFSFEYGMAPDYYVKLNAANLTTPATFSLDGYQVGENKIIYFKMLHTALAFPAEPIVRLHLKKDIDDFGTRITVELRSADMIVKSFVEDVEMTSDSWPVGLAPAVWDELHFIIRNDKVGAYLNGTAAPIHIFDIDPAIPDDLYLHFETVQTSEVDLMNVSCINNFHSTPVVTYTW